MHRRFLIVMVAVLSLLGGLSAPASAQSPSKVRNDASLASVVTTVGLGDSVPSGLGCDCRNYVTRTGLGVAAHHHASARVLNYAVGGYTSGQVAARAASDSVRSAVASARLVIITAGANDFPLRPLTTASCLADEAACNAAQLRTMSANLTTIVRRVRAANPRVTVVLTDYFNVFWDGAVGRARGAKYVRGSNALTVAANARISAVARANRGMFLDTYHLFKGPRGTSDDTVLLSDGMHPNARGHALITTAILTRLYD